MRPLPTLAPLAASLSVLAAVAVLATPSPATACGGCFAPTETVTVVTNHRMAVAMGPTETTLWDQIEYAGEPEDFVWVLPIQGEVLVELADNAFFEALDQTSRLTLQVANPVQSFCPDPCADSRGAGPSPSAGADGGVADVTVYGEAVVGPYETATIGSEDPEALVVWLRDNGYTVPDSILPTIAHYVDLGMNFAVLRLNPNAGVNQMQPVRVTTPGMNPVFPLRMVAAGAEGSIGLELYVFAEGRYESQNFAVVEVDRDRISYDWAASSFNYGELFDAAIADAGGKAWVAEYAQPPSQFHGFINSYASYDDASEPHFAADDYAIVLRSLEEPYLTKLRTDLDVAFLGEDLILSAATGGDIGNFELVEADVNRPPDPVCPSTCDDPWIYGDDPGRLGFGSRSRGDGLCSVQPGLPGGLWFFAAAAAAALAALLVLRRRQRIR